MAATRDIFLNVGLQVSLYKAKKWFVFIISVHTYLYEPLSARLCEPLEKLKDSDNVLSVCGNNN